MISSKSTYLYILLAVVSVPFLLNGCATIRPPVEKPTISVSDLRIQEIKALEAIFKLELRIMNPNDFPLDIHGINCNLEIDGKHFATGLSDKQQEVPAFGTATMPVIVYASVFDMASSVIKRLQEVNKYNGTMEPLNYELAGNVRLAGNGSPQLFPFQSTGEIDFGGQAHR